MLKRNETPRRRGLVPRVANAVALTVALAVAVAVAPLTGAHGHELPAPPHEHAVVLQR